MTDDMVLTFTGEEADFLRKAMRRAMGDDLEGYLFENIWEDYNDRARCIWDEEFHTTDYCKGCDFLEGCPDAITEAK